MQNVVFFEIGAPKQFKLKRKGARGILPLNIVEHLLAMGGAAAAEVNSEQFSDTGTLKRDQALGPALQSLLLGVALLLALAAFVLSVRNARELKRCKEQLHRDRGGKPEV